MRNTHGSIAAWKRRSAGLLFLVFSTSAPIVPSAAVWKIEESTQELSARYVRMPGSPTAPVEVLVCDGCQAGSFRFSDDVKFEVMNNIVSFSDFISEWRTGRFQSVFIHSRLATGEVFLVRIYP